MLNAFTPWLSMESGLYFLEVIVLKKQVLRMAMMAMFTAVSVVLVYFIHFPLIPAAPFLEYDMADVPILLCAMLLDTGSGIVVLFAAALIQALTVSASSGWIGFVMHFIATSVLIIASSLVYIKFGKNIKSLIFGLVAGTIAMTVVMIPLNLVFTGVFLGAGVKTVVSMLIPAIIPFNLLKAGINSAVTFALFYPLKKAFNKIYKA